MDLEASLKTTETVTNKKTTDEILKEVALMDQKSKAPFTGRGHRIPGHRKQKLIDYGMLLFQDTVNRGISGAYLLKHLGFPRNSAIVLTTKQWSGYIGRLNEFRRANSMEYMDPPGGKYGNTWNALSRMKLRRQALLMKDLNP